MLLDVSRRLYVFAHNNLRLILALETGAVTDMCVYLWAGAYFKMRTDGLPALNPVSQSLTSCGRVAPSSQRRTM